jgi:FixJ family two-component response regulator
MADSPKVSRAVVSVVDDDESVREALPGLLTELGYSVEVYSSAEQFLASQSIGQVKCLLLDVGMPGMSGPELQAELKSRGWRIPVIFITAQTDEGLRSRLIQGGAVNCLFKPFSDEELQRSLGDALVSSE